MGVETWLKMVEDEMIKTLTKRIKECFSFQQKEQTSKKDWILKYSCQAVSVSGMLMWTEMTEYAI
jgi:hypothetical protein